LVCLHCSETLVPWDELPEGLRAATQSWAERYSPVHDVAHWEDRRRKRAGNYDRVFEDAARQAERLLAELGRDIAPGFLDDYAALVWEDADECLDVRPEDIPLE
jgi:hypothetical protein